MIQEVIKIIFITLGAFFGGLLAGMIWVMVMIWLSNKIFK